MKFTLSILGFAALTFALPQTTSTPPPSFKMTNVISGGTGCPRGSIYVDWTDSRILPISFGEKFTAVVGPSTEIAGSRKFCHLTLHLDYTPGYSFAVYSAEYTGFAELDAGVTGTVMNEYYFSGVGEQTSSSLVLSGPTKVKFRKQDDVAVSVWSPCGGDALFNVDASVALTPLAGPVRGVLGIARESGRLSSNLYVQWRRC